MSDAIPTAVEQWRPVPGYEGRYEVSDQGKVRSYLTCGNTFTGRLTTPRVLKLHVNIDGYHTINLHLMGKRRWWFVHRLVLIAFVGLDPERPECNHKNGIKTDARLENIEWVTSQENVQHSYDVLNRYRVKGSKNGRSKLTEGDVIEIRRLYTSGMMYKEIGPKFGVHPGMVGYIVRRDNWTHI